MSADIAKAMNLTFSAVPSSVKLRTSLRQSGDQIRDAIVSPNGKPLDRFAELRSRIATTQPGTRSNWACCAMESRSMSK